MTLSLVLMYVIAILVLSVCVIKDMRRSLLRGSVSLILTLLAIPLSAAITHALIDRITSGALHLLDLSNADSLMRAFPSLEDGVVALVHMVAAPEVWRILFLLLWGLLALGGWALCLVLEHKKPALAKKSKPIGAAIGAVSGVVLVVALLAPTAGYASIAPEVVHTIEEVDHIGGAQHSALLQDAQRVQSNALRVSNTPLLKTVRFLGGSAMFRSLTYVTVDGEPTNLQKEVHAIDLLGADVEKLSAVPVEQYGDEEYEALEDIGDVLGQSVLLRVLGAEGLSELSRAWLSGEPFLGIAKPKLDAVTTVALDAAMYVLRDTTKDTVADDINAIAPAVTGAIRALNAVDDLINPAPVAPGEPDAPETGVLDKVGQIVDAVVEAADSPDVREALIRAGIDLLAKEYQDQLFGGPAPDAPPSKPDDPAGPVNPVDPADPAGPNDPVKPSDPTDPVIPDIPDVEDLPDIEGEVDVTQEQYDSFVAALTDLALSGIMSKTPDQILADVLAVRDAIGVNISDEQCRSLVNSVLDSPFVSIFQ